MIIAHDDVMPGEVIMNHHPRQIIELRDHVSAYEASLSKAVLKFCGTELSIHNSLDLAVNRLGYVDLSTRSAYTRLISLARNLVLESYLAYAIDTPFRS